MCSAGLANSSVIVDTAQLLCSFSRRRKLGLEYLCNLPKITAQILESQDLDPILSDSQT